MDDLVFEEVDTPTLIPTPLPQPASRTVHPHPHPSSSPSRPTDSTSSTKGREGGAGGGAGAEGGRRLSVDASGLSSRPTKRVRSSAGAQPGPSGLPGGEAASNGLAGRDGTALDGVKDAKEGSNKPPELVLPARSLSSTSQPPALLPSASSPTPSPAAIAPLVTSPKGFASFADRRASLSPASASEKTSLHAPLFGPAHANAFGPGAKAHHLGRIPIVSGGSAGLAGSGSGLGGLGRMMGWDVDGDGEEEGGTSVHTPLWGPPPLERTERAERGGSRPVTERTGSSFASVASRTSSAALDGQGAETASRQVGKREGRAKANAPANGTNGTQENADEDGTPSNENEDEGEEDDDDVLLVESDSPNALPHRGTLVAEPETIDLTSAAAAASTSLPIPPAAAGTMHRTKSDQARFAAHAQTQLALAMRQAAQKREHAASGAEGGRAKREYPPGPGWPSSAPQAQAQGQGQVQKQQASGSYPGGWSRPPPFPAPPPPSQAGAAGAQWPPPRPGGSLSLPAHPGQYPHHPAAHLHPSHQQGSGVPLPDDAPVCIGLLSSLVLILFPVKEFEAAPKVLPDGRGFAPQTLGVSLMRGAPNNKSETIKVISREGEQFGVVEHRVANVLGPFIGGINSLSAQSAAGGWINPLRSVPASASQPQASTSKSPTSKEMRDPADGKESSSSSADDEDDDDEIVETEGLGGKKRKKLPASTPSHHTRDVYLEACVVRRGEQAPLMLPLQLLVFCVPSSVARVASALASANVWLEHPISYDPNLHAGCRYANPHSHHARQAQVEQDLLRRRLMGGAYGGGLGASSAAAFGGLGGGRGQGVDPAKRTEVQREQVNEVFKSLRSGVDLPHVEPPETVTTSLYPHQKQALAFMLDREAKKEVHDDGSASKASASGSKTLAVRNGKVESEEEENMISLWTQKRDPYGRLTGWSNVVTGVDKYGKQPPPQCRGSILADDMGLGKTITVISLIAATVDAASKFANLPPTTTRESFLKGEGFDALEMHGAGEGEDQPIGLSATNAWGNLASSDGGGGGRGRKKKESKTAKKRKEAEEERLALLKVRSRATLIVCPLSTVQNWESQIDEHVKHQHSSNGEGEEEEGGKKGRFGAGAEAAAAGVASSVFSVYVYHGIGRTTSVEALADHDVVITTYSLLGAEYSRQHRGNKAGGEGKEKDGNESSDGIEEVDAEGNPVSGTTTPTAGGGAGQGSEPLAVLATKGKKKRKRKGDGSTSPLQAVQWFRVILDEAHMIKDHSTIQARAACDLVAERRACLTGTPLQNSLNDLYSLVRFLRLEPFTDRGLWTAHIGAPAKLGDPLGISRLQLIMRHLALRRTKDSKDDRGRPILALPVKREEMIHLDLDERERAFYMQHYQRSKKTFLTMEKTDSLLKNYCSILQELLRLRQICAHMALVADSEDAKTGESTDDLIKAITAHGLSKARGVALLALMRDTGAAQCAECGAEMVRAGLAVERDDVEDDAATKKPAAKRGKKKGGVNAATVENDESLPPSQRAVVTRCQHLFCLECFRAQVCEGWPHKSQATDRATCSACREEITPVIDAMEVLPSELEAYSTDSVDASEAPSKKKGKASEQQRVVEHSTKIRTLLMDLLRFSAANPASANFSPNNVQNPPEDDPDAPFKPTSGIVVKSIVFSQWTKLLDRIGDGLDECNISYARLDGTMSRVDRSRAMDTFRTEPKCEVMLVSLRAGGVGLNLTAASRVYVMEPFWNPAVENQAIDRVHRLGQTRPVHTIRYIISGSIEQNMLEIQRRKTELANMSLSNTLSKAQLAQRRIDDLRTLFKDPSAKAGPFSSTSTINVSGSDAPDIMVLDD